jgi:hypothetical protein
MFKTKLPIRVILALGLLFGGAVLVGVGAVGLHISHHIRIVLTWVGMPMMISPIPIIWLGKGENRKCKSS